MSWRINHFYRFGEFTIDADQKVLLRQGKSMLLAPKVLETLLILVNLENSDPLKIHSAAQTVRAVKENEPAVSKTVCVSTQRRIASIPVLPFVDMSPDRDQDYFCEGLADELINSLALLLGATALIELGDTERGLDWTRRALELDSQDPNVLYNAACAFSISGELGEAMTCLEKSLPFCADRKWVDYDSYLDPLRSLPKFQELLRVGPEEAPRY